MDGRTEGGLAGWLSVSPSGRLSVGLFVCVCVCVSVYVYNMYMYVYMYPRDR